MSGDVIFFTKIKTSEFCIGILKHGERDSLLKATHCACLLTVREID